MSNNVEMMKYYGHFQRDGVHLPVKRRQFPTDCGGQCIREYVNGWMDNLPSGRWPTWSVSIQSYLHNASGIYVCFDLDLKKLLMEPWYRHLFHCLLEAYTSKLRVFTFNNFSLVMRWQNVLQPITARVLFAALQCCQWRYPAPRSYIMGTKSTWSTLVSHPAAAHRGINRWGDSCSGITHPMGVSPTEQVRGSVLVLTFKPIMWRWLFLLTTSTFVCSLLDLD